MSKQTLIESWNKMIESYSNDLSFPSSLYKLEDGWKDITKAGSATNYNAAVAQNGFGDEYSYEEGYFKAFQVIAEIAKVDSDSFIMPTMFMARHFIELTLKDLIFNLSITFGEPLATNQKNSHDLKALCDKLRELALKFDFPQFADYTFSKIIYQIDDISPKSDEYRYPTDQKGLLNIKKDNMPSLINIKALNHNISYLYNLTQSLLIVINNDSDSFSEGSIYSNESIIELIKLLMHSKFSTSEGKDLKNKITGIIGSNQLDLDKKCIKMKNNTMFYGGAEVLTFIQEGNKTLLKTQRLIDYKR